MCMYEALLQGTHTLLIWDNFSFPPQLTPGSALLIL